MTPTPASEGSLSNEAIALKALEKALPTSTGLIAYALKHVVEAIDAAEARGRQSGLEEAANVIRDVISEDFDTTGSLVKAIRAIEARTRISKGGGE